MTATAVPASVADVDFIDLELFVHGDPHAAWKLLRREAPVHWNEGKTIYWTPSRRDLYHPGFWNITKHRDVFTISRDPETFISGRGIALAPQPPDNVQDVAEQFQGAMMIESDPPRHTKLRQLVNKGFSPRAVGRLDSHIRDITTRIIDDLHGRDDCDFVVEVAAKLPLAVICELMGVPQGDWELMFDLSNRAIGSTDPEYQTDQTMGGAEMVGAAYFMKMMEERRLEPRQDLVSALLGAEIDGDGLSDIDILLFCFLLIIAGNETTRNATSGGMLALLENPEQHERLASEPALVPSAIEEVLRWTSPVTHMTRVATRDVDVAGTTIKEGQRVAMWYASANRDEDVFDDPDRFDVGREPNEHLAFGVGEHFCLGANLARLELVVMFEELMRRLPAVKLAGPAERLRSNFISGIKHMPVTVGEVLS